MKTFYYTLIYCLFAIHSFGQYSDPNFPKPTTGYGADGTHAIGIDSFPNPYYLTRNIEIFYPSDINTKVPTIFYSHAYGAYDPQIIIGLINFVAKKGYALVFVPYQTSILISGQNRYANLLNGFRLAARNYPNIIDTTKVGFMGWSFGGGASFANAYTCFKENNWGTNGRFIYAMAQWYSLNISQTQLQTFPADTKLLTEIFNDDVTNDHRMAIDIFNNINIPDSLKDFILLKSDTIGSYVYLANHAVPRTDTAFNALDYYGIYRLLDALCDYTFNGNLAGKNVALGHGSAAQTTMPTVLKNLIETETPLAMYPESKFEFPCSGNINTVNPRSSYCPAISYYAIAANVYPASSGSFSGSGNYILGQTVSLKATAANGYTFINWTENGTPVSTNSTFQFIATGNRTLVANFQLNTAIENVPNEDLIVIFPNPANGIVTVKTIQNNEPFGLTIYNFTGKEILSGKNIHQVDFSNFSSGTYLMIIKQNGQIWKNKIIKQ